MKSLLVAAGAIAALAAAAPAFAQSSNISGYGNLGLADINADDANIGAVTGRLGVRFGRYFGVEGELSGGFNSAGVDNGGVRADASVRDQYAGYAVGFLPVMPNADLFARIGYGAQDIHLSSPTVNDTFNATSWNVGAGGQYFFTDKDGVRAEYTRVNTTDRSDLDANVFSLAYVRKF